MQVYRSFLKFNSVTGIIDCSDRLSSIGIEASDRHGSFYRNKVDELIKFCKQNPEYHIVTYKPNLKINKYIPGALLYLLADGDPDPLLLYSTAMDEEELEIFKLRIAQATA